MLVKETDVDISIRGYASVFDRVDRSNDSISRGAFKDTLKEQKSKITLLWQHDASSPIGVITKIKEDNYGLYITASITSNTNIGREAIHLIQSGIVSGLSVGIVPERSRISQHGYNEILKVMLYEISVVTFPANVFATITSVYLGLDSEKNLRDLIQLSKATSSIIQQLN